MHASTSIPSMPGDNIKSRDHLNKGLKSNADSGSETLVPLWPKRAQCSKEEFENAVENFFSVPEMDTIKENIYLLDDMCHQKSLLLLENAVHEQKQIFGYVYSLWNPLFPDLLKIGATFRTPQIRARELSGTGMPEPFEVVAELKCRNPFGMEREIHTHYKDVRKYGKKKEFFTLEAEDVRKYFQTLKLKAMRLQSREEEIKIRNRARRVRVQKWKKIVQTSKKLKPESKTCGDTGSDATMGVSDSVPASFVPPLDHVEDCTEKMRNDQDDAGPKSIQVTSRDNIHAIDDIPKEMTEFISELSKIKQLIDETDLTNATNFIKTITDGASALKESTALLVETNQRLFDVYQKALNLKLVDELVTKETKQSLIEQQLSQIELQKRQTELQERQTELQQRQIELERQRSIISAENRQRALDMDYKEFKFAELKYDSSKKRRLQEEAP
jgi:hypothetical protein